MDPFEIPVGDEQEIVGKFELGQQVFVASPRPNDLWNHSFVGTVIDFGPGVLSVIDQDENIFDMNDTQAQAYEEEE